MAHMAIVLTVYFKNGKNKECPISFFLEGIMSMFRYIHCVKQIIRLFIYFSKYQEYLFQDLDIIMVIQS